MQASPLRRLDRVAYLTQHFSLLVNSILVEQAARAIARQPAAPLPREVIKLVRQRLRELLDRDLANVERGYYPRELLFQFPYRDYVRTLPALLRDAPRTVRRMRTGNYQDLPDDVDTRRYPPYYRRNFHWQTDGYFSRRSARLYDVGVEFLFRGTADVMRRQIIPPITRFLAGSDPCQIRLLDIACGTGRTLKQLATAHPDLRYHGLDLSPYYIQAARELLAGVRDLSLISENAEDLPYCDGYFDVVTSVYLFHELPRNARRRVLREAYRVLRPGGLLVLEDSTQLRDSKAIAETLAAFPRQYHEPFYNCYLRDDLAAMVQECGFEVSLTETHLVARVVAARKPAH